MADKKLLELALTHSEHNCAAYLLIGFAAQYLEGEMDSSKDIFNKYIKEAPDGVLRLMIHDNTFGCVTKICQQILVQREIDAKKAGRG